MKLIVGLGNPGQAYATHRHNIGFRCVEQFAAKHGLTWKERAARSLLASGAVAGVPVVLAKPQTFMNNSGEAVAPLVKRFSISLPDLLVVYDDMDLPFGTIRIRERGSAGGHKGLGSIIERLRSEEVPRLRVGIGRPAWADPEQVIEYVLSPFDATERAELPPVLDLAVEAIDSIVTEGITTAMNRYNRR